MNSTSSPKCPLILGVLGVVICLKIVDIFLVCSDEELGDIYYEATKGLYINWLLFPLQDYYDKTYFLVLSIALLFDAVANLLIAW